MANRNLKKLIAFPLMHEAHAHCYSVLAHAKITSGVLKVNFRIEAKSVQDFKKIILGHREDGGTPTGGQRRNELWKGTCFECFIPSRKSNAYLEFNGAPDRSWNWYSFKNYRDGMQDFKLLESACPKQNVWAQSDRFLECEWALPLIGIQQGFQSVGENHHDFDKVGLSLVMHTTEATTYWALQHDGVKPDFHLKSSFCYPIATEKG